MSPKILDEHPAETAGTGLSIVVGPLIIILQRAFKWDAELATAVATIAMIIIGFVPSVITYSRVRNQ